MTERANHAKEYLQEADLSRFDGFEHCIIELFGIFSNNKKIHFSVICVGGDGMFNEVLSGLVLRCQREFQIDINDRNSRFQRIPLRIGIIPAGN